MILAAREDRILLLRAGFRGKQIEALYSVLNGFEIVGVNWDGAATKPAQSIIKEVTTMPLLFPAAGVKAARSQEEARA